jgi:hypothetical protein
MSPEIITRADAFPLVEGQADLAAQIRAEHAAFMEAGRRTIEHAFALGGLLIEAKEKAGHGNWLPWLAEHCPNISERHEQNFMAMASEL